MKKLEAFPLGIFNKTKTNTLTAAEVSALWLQYFVSGLFSHCNPVAYSCRFRSRKIFQFGQSENKIAFLGEYMANYKHMSSVILLSNACIIPLLF